MKIVVGAIGKTRRSPEAELCADYESRFAALCRPLGLKPLSVMTWDEPAGPDLAEREAHKLRKALVPGGRLVVLDERGRSMTSPDLAATLSRWRDAGVPTASFLIGGAAGLAPSLRAEADLVLGFGAATWPHMLARVMLLEQLYRASTIMAGHPYHKA
ncbi:MAG: 23S rRNA (pseudouridine(1915)-N(3))-methyltransferase RlmH [Alphaproteobacteria bacterium]